MALKLSILNAFGMASFEIKLGKFQNVLYIFEMKNIHVCSEDMG